MRVGSFASVLIAAALAAPASAAPPDHRAKGDAAIAARRVLVKYCSECHGETAAPHRGRLDVHDHATLVGNAGPVPFADPDKPTSSQILQLIRDGSMPPGQRPRPTATEIAALERWVQVQAPIYPAGFSEERVLKLVADDLVGRPEKDRGAFRYLSLAHLADLDKPDLAASEADLAVALSKPDGAFDRLLSPLSKSAGTIYRLDLRELRWNATGLFELNEDEKATNDEFAMVPFDLIQLEYPYPPPKPAEADAAKVKQAVAEMNPHRKNKPLEQLRAVPFVRADWLAKALRKGGKPTPLADELTALSELAALDPTKRANEPPSGPPPRLFEGGEPGPVASPWAWYQAAVPEGKSEVGLNVQNRAGGQLPPGGGNVELRAVAEHAVYVTLVDVGTDDLARVLPLKTSKLAPNKSVNLAKEEKGTIFVAQPKGGGGSVFFLVFASLDEPKGPPVLVRSRHAAPGIWRVVPNELDAKQPDGKTLPVARVVLKIDFKKED